MTMWSLLSDQAFQDKLQDQAKLKWIQEEELMCISTIKGTWIVISCTILTTVKIGIMATNPVLIHSNKVIDAGQIHAEDQCRGIDLDRGTATAVKIIRDRKIHLLPESCNEMVNITRMLARKKEQTNFLYSQWNLSNELLFGHYYHIAIYHFWNIPIYQEWHRHLRPSHHLPHYIWEVEGTVFWF